MLLNKMFMRLSAVSLFLIGTLASANTFEKGLDALRGGNEVEAVKLLAEAGESGDSNAQYYLGLLYFHGRGVAKDLNSAINWWKKSAKNGNPNALLALYTLSVNSNYPPEELPGVLTYLSEAAKKGSLEAKNNLSFLQTFLRAQQPIAKLDNDVLRSKSDETPKEAELRLGKKIYTASCASCHDAGLAGSPKARSKKDWEKRLSQGFDTLVMHATKGMPGTGMLPKGGNLSLKEEEVVAAVRYMTTF